MSTSTYPKDMIQAHKLKKWVTFVIPRLALDVACLPNLTTPFLQPFHRYYWAHKF